jgi:hypothetical protein
MSANNSIGCVQNDFWAYGTLGRNRAPILRQNYHYLQTDPKKLPIEPHHQGVPSGASTMILEPMVHLGQTVHLYCTNTYSVSKWTKARFHMTHVTQEFHRVRPKWFPSLWYVWHKLCTYLVSRLVLSPNGLKQASNWASSPRSTIGCVQNDFWAYGPFGMNRVHILRYD